MMYEAGTRRMTRAFTVDETNPIAATDRNYTYDPAGNPTGIEDLAGTQDDIQCFKYDGLQRLTEAWTPSSGPCASPTVGGLGGPAPSWLSWTYTASGLRATQTDHRTSGDLTTSYTYPAATAARPHALAATTTTGGPAMTYSYDAAGNTTARPGTSGPQTISWDAEGRSATITEGALASGHLYSADGSRLIRRDPNETVLYLGPTEIHRAANGTLTAVRHYAHNGTTIATRDNSGVIWLVPDHEGTPLVAVNATTQVVTRRYQTPFGGSRGAAPPAWPSQRGYVGGVTDPAAGLVRLGARDYDPGTGRFLSVDPLLAPEDPQSLAAYTYANNNPVTHADPTGLMTDASGGGGSGKKSSSNKKPKNSCRNVYQCEEQREAEQQRRSSASRCTNRFLCEEKRDAEQQRRSEWAKRNPPERPKKKCGLFSSCLWHPTKWGTWYDQNKQWVNTGLALGALGTCAFTAGWGCAAAGWLATGVSVVDSASGCVTNRTLDSCEGAAISIAADLAGQKYLPALRIKSEEKAVLGYEYKEVYYPSLSIRKVPMYYHPTLSIREQYRGWGWQWTTTTMGMVWGTNIGYTGYQIADPYGP